MGHLIRFRPSVLLTFGLWAVAASALLYLTFRPEATLIDTPSSGLLDEHQSSSLINESEVKPWPMSSNASINRLQIPKLDIDAEVVVLGVDTDGQMQAPDSPNEVAWYDFTASPGTSGNALFSGHLDYARFGPAVFSQLADLDVADEVFITLSDGTIYAYHVTSSTVYNAAKAPLDEIIGPTADEVITLITCAGTFDARAREYDQRVIVRAHRIPES